jgi:hypothetical protein
MFTTRDNENRQKQPINNVLWLNAHNAYNSEAYWAFAPNQIHSITQVLDFGARMVELDIYNFSSEAYLCHKLCWLPSKLMSGYQLLFPKGANNLLYSDAIKEVGNWLSRSDNADEVIILKFEDGGADGLSEDSILKPLLLSIGSDRIFTPDDLTKFNGAWPSIEELRLLNKNVIIMSQSQSEKYSKYFHDGSWGGPYKLLLSTDKVSTFDGDCSIYEKGPMQFVEVGEDGTVLSYYYGKIKDGLPSFIGSKFPKVAGKMDKENAEALYKCGVNVFSIDGISYFNDVYQYLYAKAYGADRKAAKFIYDKMPVTDIVWVGAHNAYNSGAYSAWDPNQYLSFEEMLGLGVRSLELDLHWQYDAVRLCHKTCIDPKLSFLSPMFPQFTENMTFDDGLQKIADWLGIEENKEEVLLLQFEDWGAENAPEEAIIDPITKYFGEDKVFSKADLDRSNGEWPSLNELKAAGKQVIILSWVFGDHESGYFHDGNWGGANKYLNAGGVRAKVGDCEQLWHDEYKFGEVGEDRTFLGLNARMLKSSLPPAIANKLPTVAEVIEYKDIVGLRKCSVNIFNLDKIEYFDPRVEFLIGEIYHQVEDSLE